MVVVRAVVVFDGGGEGREGRGGFGKGFGRLRGRWRGGLLGRDSRSLSPSLLDHGIEFIGVSCRLVL